jgi:hypothetical protein
MAKKGERSSGLEQTDTADSADNVDGVDYELEQTLYARHAEVEALKELAGVENQRGTPIPALFNQFYKFIQNPSTVSVETYKRMVDTDDTIGSGVDFLTICLAARLGRYQHPSKEVTQWVNDRLDEIEGGFFNCIKEVMSATWAGFYVGEKVWANTDNGFVPHSIIGLPPSTILYETDRTGRITDDGILQYQRNYNPMALASGLGFFTNANQGAIGGGFHGPDAYAKMGDLPFPMRMANTFNYMSVRIPRVKCIHYAFDAQGKFGNPYGRSLLRRAYKYYVLKDSILKMMAVALDRKGTPLSIIYADPNTTIVDQTKANRGDGADGARGKDVGISADVAAQQAFKNIHNDTFIVLPGKKDDIYGTDFMPQDSNTESFISALNYCDRSIMRALLIPSLIFTNGDGQGSHALGQEHGRTFDKIMDGSNAGVRQVLREQLIREMLAYNFPESVWKKDGLGDFSRRDFSQDEQQKVMEVYEKGITNGVIDSNDLNDLNKMRETIGFEARKDIIQKPDPFAGMDFSGEGIDPDESTTSKTGGKAAGGGKQIKPDESGNFHPEENFNR